MEVLYDDVGGRDVRKASVTAGVARRDRTGAAQRETPAFSTMAAGILALASRLAGCGASYVAMESSGVYWKPVLNLLAELFADVLVSTRLVKRGPGRKADVGDTECPAELQFPGLLTPSVTPPWAQRDLRDLARLCSQRTSEQGRVVNRVLKALEDTGCRRSAVATTCRAFAAEPCSRRCWSGRPIPRRWPSRLAGARARSYRRYARHCAA